MRSATAKSQPLPDDGATKCRSLEGYTARPGSDNTYRVVDNAVNFVKIAIRFVYDIGKLKALLHTFG